MVKVLVVDDHRSVLWGLAKLIESASGELELAGTASSADEARAAAARLQPDVVLLDLALGTSNGVDLIAELRDGGAAVLVLSGFAEAELQERAVIEGASGFVHKSEPADVILKAIARVAAGELWL